MGGLWPAELAKVTPETALLADYLNADLRRIADSANEKLHAIGRSGLAGQDRQAAEARVVNVARAFAVLRVESTVRQLHREALDLGTEYLGLNPVSTPVESTEPVAEQPRHRLPEPVGAGPADPPVTQVKAEPVPVALDPVPAPPPVVPEVTESDDQRLQRLLAFVARQQPGLRWAIGRYPDGVTRLATDIAGGWIPPGIDLPADVELLDPVPRTGTAAEMLGVAMASAAYSPGDRLGWASDVAVTEVSVQPRSLPPVEDLGWQLGEVTHWREGLPRMANTLVRAGSAGTGVAEAEIDLLRVYLDTMRYQLLGQYPDVDSALVLNCILLSAAEGIATGDTVSANYHYSWYLALSAGSSGSAGQGDSQKSY